MRLPPRVWKILRSRRTKLALACSPFVVITLAALSYPVCGWIGRHSVDRFVKSMRSKGYTTNLQEYYSDRGPAAEDVFRQPAMLGEETDDHLQALRYLEPAIPGFSKRPVNGDPALALPADIRTWLTPSPNDEKEAARRLLTAIEPFSRRLDELREVLKLPRATWPGDDGLGPGDDALQKVVGTRFKLRPITEFAAEEASLLLVLGESDRAAANLETIFDCQRLFLSFKSDLTAGLLSEALVRRIGNLIWEGVARSAWTDPQLAAFDEALSRIGNQSLFVSAFPAEAAFLESWAEKVKGLKREQDSIHYFDGWEADLKAVRGRILGIWRELRPAGITMLRHLEGQRIFFREGTLKDGVPRRHFELEDLVRFRNAQKSYAEAIHVPGDGMDYRKQDIDADAWSSLGSLVTTALRSEANIALVRTGIALERYRLQHGNHPASLEELVPAFLPSVPIDPFTRKPLQYRLQPDGSPHVWSIGPNLIDEAGLPKRDRNEGDLIWITRPLPGYTKKQYLKP